MVVTNHSNTVHVSLEYTTMRYSYIYTINIIKQHFTLHLTGELDISKSQLSAIFHETGNHVNEIS